MLDYLADRLQIAAYADASALIDNAIKTGFQANRLRPVEFGGDMGTRAIIGEIRDLIAGNPA